MEKKCENCVNYKRVKELVEKADKYRWHDLRENQNDLPKKDGTYLIAYYDYENNETCYCWYWLEVGKKISGDIFAWKEIERIEEEE